MNEPDEQCRTQFAEGPCAGTRLHSGDCTPNADDIELSPEPEAHEHTWTEWGAVYHGGHLRWRDCRGCGNTESTPEGHFCPECAPVCEAPNGCHTPSACKESCAFADQLKGIRMVPRAEPEPEAPVCGHPRPREITRGDTYSSFICDECDQTWDMHKAVPPRPPILVAYATGSGDLNELALPGDVTAAVVDGSLVISHASGVLGIVHVKPWELEN